jgi:hypothetical protein
MGPAFLRIAALAGAIFLLAEGPPDEATRVIQMSGERSAAVKSYTFALHVDFALRSFPYLGFHLDGRGKWERPNLYSVSFRNVPWFAKGFENIKMDPLEPQTWPHDYDFISVTQNGTRHHIEMRDKTAGHLKGIHAELDGDGLRRVQWLYLNGGKITVDINPVDVNGYPVPGTEQAEIQLPGYHVVAKARFDDYKIVTDADDGQR